MAFPCSSNTRAAWVPGSQAPNIWKTTVACDPDVSTLGETALSSFGAKRKTRDIQNKPNTRHSRLCPLHAHPRAAIPIGAPGRDVPPSCRLHVNCNRARDFTADPEPRSFHAGHSFTTTLELRRHQKDTPRGRKDKRPPSDTVPSRCAPFPSPCRPAAGPPGAQGPQQAEPSEGSGVTTSEGRCAAPGACSPCYETEAAPKNKAGARAQQRPDAAQ